MIDSFRDRYDFLSNAFAAPISLGKTPSDPNYDGIVYPTVEHAYQASKTNVLTERQDIALAVSAQDAKRLGQKVTLIQDWDNNKVGVMEDLVRTKFQTHIDLKIKLLMTGTEELVQGNSRDTFWGVNLDMRGYNYLGNILMDIREEIVETEGSAWEVTQKVLDSQKLGFLLPDLTDVLEYVKGQFILDENLLNFLNKFLNQI